MTGLGFRASACHETISRLQHVHARSDTPTELNFGSWNKQKREGRKKKGGYTRPERVSSLVTRRVHIRWQKGGGGLETRQGEDCFFGGAGQGRAGRARGKGARLDVLAEDRGGVTPGDASAGPATRLVRDSANCRAASALPAAARRRLARRGAEERIYIYIYIYVCVCVCMCSALAPPLHALGVGLKWEWDGQMDAH